MTQEKPAPQILVAFSAGVLFAVGLVVSQMVNPTKVLNFLDVTGDWDPTLAFVMGGAVLVTIPMFHWVLKQPHPLFATKFFFPTRRDVDIRLVAGSAIFGIGWGISGLCPGPAIAALASGFLPVIGFVLAMTAGALVHKFIFERSS